MNPILIWSIYEADSSCVVGQCIVWVKEHKRPNALAHIGWFTTRREIRGEIKSGSMALWRREGEMRRRTLTFSVFLPLLFPLHIRIRTFTHTLSDGRNMHMVAFLKVLQPRVKPRAWPEVRERGVMGSVYHWSQERPTTSTVQLNPWPKCWGGNHRGRQRKQSWKHTHTHTHVYIWNMVTSIFENIHTHTHTHISPLFYKQQRLSSGMQSTKDLGGERGGKEIEAIRSLITFLSETEVSAHRIHRQGRRST